AEGDLGVLGDHRFESLPIDDEALRFLEDRCRRGPWLRVQNRELAQKLAPPQPGDRPDLTADFLRDLNDPRLDDVHHFARVPLVEEDVADAELATETSKERVRHAVKALNDATCPDPDKSKSWTFARFSSLAIPLGRTCRARGTQRRGRRNTCRA